MPFPGKPLAGNDIYAKPRLNGFCYFRNQPSDPVEFYFPTEKFNTFLKCKSLFVSLQQASTVVRAKDQRSSSKKLFICLETCQTDVLFYHCLERTLPLGPICVVCCDDYSLRPCVLCMLQCCISLF